MVGLIVLVVVFAICYYAISNMSSGGQPQTAKSYPFSEIQDDPRFPHVRTICTKVRGVTKRNDDGMNRQRIIRQCCGSGDALYLEREPTNPVDRNAIKVRRIVCTEVPDKPKLGEQLGYLSRELAEELAPRMDKRGHVLMAKIKEVTGRENGHSLGVNIQVEEYRPAVARKEDNKTKSPASP